MSQANDLLNSLSGYDADLTTVDPTTEPHIVIGSDRFISVPSTLKKIAVQHDNNVETVTFDCPRYWDGLDMSQMVIYINYKRPDGDLGAYVARNVIVDSNDANLMHFDWTITDHVTRYKGTLIFNVCIKKTDEYNHISNHWNSELNSEMTISEGLECDVIFEEPSLDVTTQVFDRMNEVETYASGIEGRLRDEIDGVNEGVDELKQDLTDLTECVHNIIADMPNVLGERMEKTSTADTFNVNPSNWGTRQIPFEQGVYFGIFDISVENVSGLPNGTMILANLRNSDSVFSAGDYCFTDLSLYPSNLQYNGENVSKRIYCKFTINSANNYLLGARVSGSGSANKTITVTFTSGAIFKITDGSNDSQEMFDCIDLYEKYGYKTDYTKSINVSANQIVNTVGIPSDKEITEIVLKPIMRGDCQGIVFDEKNSYKYPNIPIWGNEYLEHWYERVYEGIADSAVISLEGDSITQGYAPTNTYFPNECFANMRGYAIKKIMKAGNYPMDKLTVFNNGHGGRSTCEWVGNATYGSTTYVPQYPNGFLDIGMQRNPDLMIIAYGMNDADSTNTRFPNTIEGRINLFETNMREGLERIRGNVSVNGRPSYNKSVKDLSIIICMPTVADWDNTGRNNNKWNQYLREVIQKLCREYYCAFADMTMRTYDHKMDGSKCWSVHDAGTQPTSGSLGIHPNKWSNAQTMAMLQDLIFPTTMWIMDTSDF